MNSTSFLTGITLALVAGVLHAGGPVERPIACQLSAGAFEGRSQEISELFGGSTEVKELEDGYGFRFPADGDWAERLLGFVQGERECCDFFRFELIFEPEQGPVWLNVRGSAEIKALIAGLLG